MLCHESCIESEVGAPYLMETLSHIVSLAAGMEYSRLGRQHPREAKA